MMLVAALNISHYERQRKGRHITPGSKLARDGDRLTLTLERRKEEENALLEQTHGSLVVMYHKQVMLVSVNMGTTLFLTLCTDVVQTRESRFRQRVPAELAVTTPSSPPLRLRRSSSPAQSREGLGLEQIKTCFTDLITHVSHNL